MAAACLHTSNPLCFWLGTPLCAEPLKKKKKMDPAILKARAEKKKGKIEKAIRQLQKHAQSLKPIDEMTVNKKLLGEVHSRTRKNPPVTEEETERRALALKSWTRYKHYQHLAEQDKLSTMILSQESALRELRAESEELYLKAIAINESFLPLTLKGPVNTPPIPGYVAPDGDYIDTTRKW
ncbi:putative 39S ribosomal protein L40, mitochondrial [Hypsibius exemplaris]|uniref:Large ribosomal subunit protein mL40 n=1 Tax=Hypsibius exemplaris TaxID=2072580 RepID=A0A1W0XF90_HYPEX|nr:putative 39S ribosomal protein L40, mitochondrial [Hypsibius exemplaris]